MDDSKDKIRRNLVVYCGALMLSAFLEIRLTETVEKVFAITAPATHPVRLTMVSMLLLGYLFIRFRHDQAQRVGYDALQNDVDSRVFQYGLKLTDAVLSKWKVGGPLNSPTWIQANHLPEFFEQRVKPRVPNAENPKSSVVIEATYANSSAKQTSSRRPWEGTMLPSFFYSNSVTSTFSQPVQLAGEGLSIKYRIPPRLRPVIWLKSWLLAMWTERGFENGLPLILALGACTLLTLRLASQLGWQIGFSGS